MADWSQSHFLQSLGWATLNSFWQMALLWCCYLGLSNAFKLPSHKKYQLAVSSVIAGFLWSAFTFYSYFQSASTASVSFFRQSIPENSILLNTILLAASIAYLGLLIFPSYRLYRNWQFVQKIKKEGLEKASLSYRLFVQKIGSHLGIPRKVMVYISDLVNSPMTIGYLKPIILLPAAALNNITTQQVEAVLLHELSHIRRYDYLVNFLVSIINTILYFNPFVKQFMRSIEAERENCCDELVLQFGYDKVSYAAALLTLEKISLQRQDLIMAATGKNYLLNRIEKIVGMEKKKGFKKTQLAGVLAALFCVIAFNSFLIIKDEKRQKMAFSYANVTNPFAVFNAEEESGSPTPAIPEKARNQASIANHSFEQNNTKTFKLYPSNLEWKESAPVTGVLQVAADDVEASLTKEQKQQVKATVNATKKVVSNMQWKAVENEIADAMTLTEKEVARHEYLKGAGQINWQNIEQNLKAQYEVLDWNKVNTNLNQALTMIQLDSLERNYSMVLSQLEKTRQDIAHSRATRSPMPDASVAELDKARTQLKQKVDKIKIIKNNKVVRL